MFKMSDHISGKDMATELKNINLIWLNLSVYARSLINSHTHLLKAVVFHRFHGEWVGLSLGG